MNGRRQERRGAATVELAICLPVLLTLVLGTVQVCTLIHLRESLCVAAYEAARLAAKGESNRQPAIDQAQAILASRQVSKGTIEIKPADLTTIAVGETITVTASVRAGDRLWLPPQFVGNIKITGQTIMVKEMQ